MLLEARQLTAVLNIEQARVRVLDDVAFTLAPGEIVDVIGPSGAGKSTLLRALARLLPAATGELQLEGRSAESMKPQEWRRQVTLLPQKPVVVPGSVRDNLLVPWKLKIRAAEHRPSDDAMRAALDMLGLDEVGLDREAVRLSVGQQGRLGFARVWLTEPRVLLLDEADAALDDASTAAMGAAVTRFAEQGWPSREASRAAVVRVRHRGDDGLASRRLRLSAGKLEEVAD